MLPNSVTNRERDEPARRQGAEEMARERPSILQQAAAAQPMNAAFNRLHIEGVDTVVHRLPTGRSSQCSRQVGRTWIGDCPLAEGRARSPRRWVARENDVTILPMAIGRATRSSAACGPTRE